MITEYKLLDWDTRNFGYKIASCSPRTISREDLNELISEFKRNDIKLIYFFIDPDDTISNSSLKNISGFLADEKITFFIRIGENDQFPYSDCIRSYESNLTSEKMKLLSLQSGIYSRFKIDSGFTNNEYEKLYTTWIDKSVKREIADEVLVYYKDGDEKGLITLRIGSHIGSIGLVSVDEKERGNSIGKELIYSALNTFRNRGISDVEVVTQKSNLIACKFYESRGFSIKNVENVFHLWIK